MFGVFQSCAVCLLSVYGVTTHCEEEEKKRKRGGGLKCIKDTKTFSPERLGGRERKQKDETSDPLNVVLHAFYNFEFIFYLLNFFVLLNVNTSP